jgi:hypothetical protein
MEHYVIISADCHAGPNAPVYRDFLDSEYRDDFEIELADARRRRGPPAAARVTCTLQAVH